MTPEQALIDVPASEPKSSLLQAASAFLATIDAAVAAGKCSHRGGYMAAEQFVDVLEVLATDMRFDHTPPETPQPPSSHALEEKVADSPAEGAPLTPEPSPPTPSES